MRMEEGGDDLVAWVQRSICSYEEASGTGCKRQRKGGCNAKERVSGPQQQNKQKLYSRFCRKSAALMWSFLHPKSPPVTVNAPNTSENNVPLSVDTHPTVVQGENQPDAVGNHEIFMGYTSDQSDDDDEEDDADDEGDGTGDSDNGSVC